MASTFSDKDTPHGLVKRIMYKKYIQAYIAKTQQAGMGYTTRIIDGFAGAGRYVNEWSNTIENHGSPIIALMVALSFLYKKPIEWNEIADNDDETQSRPQVVNGKHARNREDSEATIQLFFIEKEKEYFNALHKNVYSILRFFTQLTGQSLEHENTAERVLFRINGPEFHVDCEIRKMEFVDFDPPIVDAKTRCLAFIDPWGYTHSPMESMQKYIGQNKELLVNFMSSFVNRFVSKHPEGVAKLYGIKTQDIKAAAKARGLDVRATEDAVADFVKYIVRNCRDPENPTNDTTNCTHNYEVVLRYKANTEYSLTFEIRGENNALKYHMVFISNHVKGLEAMKESMNTCSQYDGRFGMSDYLIVRKGHTLSVKNDQNPDSVADAIFQRFHGQRTNMSEIEYFVLMETPYVFRKRILGKMEKEQNPRIVSVVNSNSEDAQRRSYTFPDWGRWAITFRKE